jgi:hypothetical protein
MHRPVVKARIRAAKLSTPGGRCAVALARVASQGGANERAGACAHRDAAGSGSIATPNESAHTYRGDRMRGRPDARISTDHRQSR